MDTIGLILSLVGTIIIFFFGLPAKISESGAIHLTAEQVDEGEIKRAKKYKVISKVGLILLAIGFLFQLLEKTI